MNVEKKNYLKARAPENVSFTDEIADILDISYDAAFRRIEGETSFTLNEGLKLSRHFNFNLNEVFIDKELDEERIVAEKHTQFHQTTL